MTGPTKPGVLFVCVHNAGRSQMAAGWLRSLAGDRVAIWSAGSEPHDHLNPLTDPAGQPIEVVRAVRDDIRARVSALVQQLF